MKWRQLGGLMILAAAAWGLFALFRPDPHAWTPQQAAVLQSLSIDSLPALPPDPSNRYADDPLAAELGRELFFDPRFSSNGQVSCATCHSPTSAFTDRLPRGQGMGQSQRRTMPLAGTSYSPWFFWDGRKDSQWSQALEPLEDANEHGGTRLQYAHLIASHYRQKYEAVFGPLPDLSDSRRFPPAGGPVADPLLRAAWEGMEPAGQDEVNRIFVNIGKALAAYERKLIPGPAAFDLYIRALQAGDRAGMENALEDEQAAGLRLFIGKGQCINCHNGPLLTNYDFHNTGIPTPRGSEPDRGRIAAVARLQQDPFNCLSSYSDAGPDDCAELRFILTSGHQIEGGFKPPSLRSVAERAPYTHTGEFKSLEEVVDHYNRAPSAAVSHSELIPLRLSAREQQQLVAFLKSLSAPLSSESKWLQAP